MASNANPVHPKTKAAGAGSAAGITLAMVVVGVLERIPSFAHLDPTTKTYIVGLLNGVLAIAGGWVSAYFAKWEPDVAAVGGEVVHAVIPNIDQMQATAEVKAKLDQLLLEIRLFMGGSNGAVVSSGVSTEADLESQATADVAEPT